MLLLFIRSLTAIYFHWKKIDPIFANYMVKVLWKLNEISELKRGIVHFKKKM